MYSLEDYLKRLRSRGIDPAQCIGQAFKTYEHLELRMRCFKAVEELQKLDPEQGAKSHYFLCAALPSAQLSEGRKHTGPAFAACHSRSGR